MHYGDYIDIQDKIIHLLYAAYYEGLYGQALIECNKEYGEDITYKAAKEFKHRREGI